MPVEVRQMLIKSTVQREPDEGEEKSPDAPAMEDLKAQVLSECRQLILDTLRERRER
jgi:Family of unknown function (DUF5908)